MPRIRKPVIPEYLSSRVDITATFGGFKRGDKVILDLDEYRKRSSNYSPNAPIENRVGLVVGVNPRHKACIVVYYPGLKFEGISGQDTYTASPKFFRRA